MKSKAMMSEPDFQKLIALVLNDLTIRRTMLENREQEVNQQMSSLEKDAELEQLDDQIQQIQRDYDHYQAYRDPNFDFDSQQYYQGPSMGLPKFP
ncbi:hypothetical protein [Limosilactobacillus panis]|nr:hypothetical protein [Limosilactobacillus panis]